MRSLPPRSAFFDLGKVLVDFDHQIACTAIAQAHGLSAGHVHAALYRPDIEGRFDKGELSGETFTAAASRALGVDLDPTGFRDAWSRVFTVKVDTLQFLHDLRARYHLVLVSNTNAWHLEEVSRLLPLAELFDDLVLSYQVGRSKPDPAFYAAARALNRGHGRAPFIDDRIENVEGATLAGFDGVLFETAAALRAHPCWRTS